MNDDAMNLESHGRKYPYLGRSHSHGEPFVVFFSKKNTGQVVMIGSQTGNIRLGMISNKFDESYFEYLPPDISVRLNND